MVCYYTAIMNTDTFTNEVIHPSDETTFHIGQYLRLGNLNGTMYSK